MALGKKKIQHQAAAGVSITNTDHFALDTYAADHADPRSFTTGFAVDFVVIKHYSTTVGETAALWAVHDKLRGACYELHFNQSYAHNCDADSIRSFDSTGFSTGDNYTTNWNAGNNYVYYAWKGGGSGTSNSDGTITSTVSANQDAGFSIVKYTGDGSGNVTTSTVGHGLSSAPELIIAKPYDAATAWQIQYAVGSDNLAGGFSSGAFGNHSAAVPTSTVFNPYYANTSNNFITYCFHSVDGYQKIGTYTGTGSSGNAINVGFQPRFVMIKNTSDIGSWILHDTARSDGTAHLRPNTQAYEDSGVNERINFTSTGFTITGTGQNVNHSDGDTYIYWAIA